MKVIDIRTRVLKLLAWLTLALMLAVAGLSAHIRLSRVDAPQETRSVEVARAGHRVAAGAALLAVIALFVLAWGVEPASRREGMLALWLLGLTIALAVLGLAAGASMHPLVVLGNLLGGAALVATSARLVSVCSRVRGAAPAMRPWLLAAAATIVALLAASQLVPGLGFAAALSVNLLAELLLAAVAVVWPGVSAA